MKRHTREEAIAAVNYRSGPGLMNEVYLGGLATAKCVSILGGRYGHDSLDGLIRNCIESQLSDLYRYKGFQWILGHYRDSIAHPEKSISKFKYEYRLLCESVKCILKDGVVVSATEEEIGDHLKGLKL